MTNLKLYDHRGNVLQTKSFNADPFFFSVSSGSGTSLTSGEIEAQPYSYHAWIHACAWVIARNVSSLPLQLVKKGTDEIVDDQWGILRLFDRPNPLMTKTTFMQHILLNLLLNDGKGDGGQCFIVPRTSKQETKYHVDLSSGQKPEVLLPFSSKYFSPALEGDKLLSLTGWKFAIQNKGITEDYTPNELIRIYLVNPYDWLSGLSSYTPAMLAMMQDVKGDLYNAKLLDNDATPSGILSSEAMLTADQKRQTMESWMEEYAGANNAHKLAVLSKGMKFQQIAMSQDDMQFAELKSNAVERIIASYGLNKIALGLYEDVNYSTIVEGRRWLWQDTYMPMGNTVLEAINSQWLYYVNDEIELQFNTSKIESLQMNYKDKISAAAQMVTQMAATPAFAMRTNGVPFTEQDAKDYPWMTERVQPQAYAMPTPEPTTPAKAVTKAAASEQVDKRRAFSDEYIKRVLLPGERMWRVAMSRFFTMQRNAMLDNVDAWAGQYKTFVEKASPFVGVSLTDILLNVSKQNVLLTKVFKPLVKDQMKREEAQLDKEINPVQWHVTDPMVEMFLVKRRDEIQSINSTTMNMVGEKIEDVIAQVNEEGGTVMEAARRIKDAISDTILTRQGHAEMIARTETGIVSSETRYDAFKAEGIEEQEWITAHDDNVRDSHRDADGQVVKVGDYFTVGNDKLLHPSDPNGSAGEIINCRCVAVAHVPVEETDGE